jgi:dihydrofolate synthase/folylpolyglutamate synthase
MNVKNNTPFTGSADVFDWLSRFINIDRGQSVKSFRLDRTELLCEIAGHPERSAEAFHVAGSKGKGSVTGMITAILTGRGLRVARYTSPHVTEYRERITLGNDFLDEAIYIAAGEELRNLIDSLRDPAGPGYALFNSDTPEGEEPAFFELLTLYFFLCVRRAKCDVMVVETGIGGRLDSTNVVDPLVSVITSIELEHTEFLGETLGDIAREKAGIIKEGRPLVLLDQDAEALAIFKKAVAEKNSRFIYFPEAVEISDLRYNKEGTRFSLAFKQGGVFAEPCEPSVHLELSLPTPGVIQAKNAALAILAVKAAFPDTDAETIKKTLGGFTLPARFERIRDTPPVIIDGAHTPQSTVYCIETFSSLYGKTGILLFGCAARKDAWAMAKTLSPQFSRIIITTPGNFKISYPEQVYDIFKSIIDDTTFVQREGKKPELIFIKDTGAAIEKTLALGQETGLPVLGIGSFYLAAEIRGRALENRVKSEG